MRMSLRMCQYQAMCCTECGQPISKPAYAAGTAEIADSYTAATGRTREEQGLVTRQCSKCGRWFCKCVRDLRLVRKCPRCHKSLRQFARIEEPPETSENQKIIVTFNCCQCGHWWRGKHIQEEWE